MLNREVYLNDPITSRLANNGVAQVKDDLSKAALETLEYELRTFVCDGAYAAGMAKILDPLLLEEMIQYNETGNFDRIIAAELL